MEPESCRAFTRRASRIYKKVQNFRCRMEITGFRGFKPPLANVSIIRMPDLLQQAVPSCRLRIAGYCPLPCSTSFPAARRGKREGAGGRSGDSRANPQSALIWSDKSSQVFSIAPRSRSHPPGCLRQSVCCKFPRAPFRAVLRTGDLDPLGSRRLGCGLPGFGRLPGHFSSGFHRFLQWVYSGSGSGGSRAACVISRHFSH